MYRDMARKYNIKYFYDIQDRSDFRANPDYKGVCHIALAQEGHCLPGSFPFPPSTSEQPHNSISAMFIEVVLFGLQRVGM